MKKHGYSLIELTIVVGLVALLGVGISSVVLMSLVTTSRTRNLTHIRETSDYALLQIKQLVRNAKKIESCSGTTNSLTVVGPDGGTTTLAVEPVGSFDRIASNSGTYLTPPDIDIDNFSIECFPDEDEPNLVKLYFQSRLATDTLRESENPITTFETSITIRNN